MGNISSFSSDLDTENQRQIETFLDQISKNH